MLASFVNAVVRAPDFRSQMKVVAERMRRGQLSMMLIGLEQGSLGKATPATVGALERIFPHLLDQNARQAIRAVLSPEFYQKANLHPRDMREVEVLQRDGTLSARTDQVTERLVREKGIPRGAAEEFKRVMLKYPRAAFLASFYEAEHIYGNGTIIMTSGEEIGGHDYQVSVLTALDLQPGQRVLHVGTGTAWPDALIADLIGPFGKLVSLDVKEDLIETAVRRFNLFGLRNSKHLVENGLFYNEGEKSFDRILFSVFLPHQLVPRHYVYMLKVGGIVQHPVAMQDGKIVYQQFIRIRDGALKERYVHSLELNSGTNELLRVLR